MYQDHHENLKDMNEIECTALVNGHKHLYSFGREKKISSRFDCSHAIADDL